MDDPKAQVAKAKEEALSALASANTVEELTAWKNTYLAKQTQVSP